MSVLRRVFDALTGEKTQRQFERELQEEWRRLEGVQPRERGPSGTAVRQFDGVVEQPPPPPEPPAPTEPAYLRERLDETLLRHWNDHLYNRRPGYGISGYVGHDISASLASAALFGSSLYPSLYMNQLGRAMGVRSGPLPSTHRPVERMLTCPACDVNYLVVNPAEKVDNPLVKLVCSSCGGCLEWKK